MRTPFSKRRSELTLDRMFQTKSHAWERVGLAHQVSQQVARRARIEALLLVPLIVGVLVAYAHRRSLFPHADTAVRVGTVIALLALGWAFARDFGRALGPALFRRLDPSTAGTVGFLIRLATVIVALTVASRIAGLDPRTLLGVGAFTAVIFGLAAQQTLGNVIAGTVLLSARPFRVGERVALQAGGLGGRIEGVVSSLGLLYTTLKVVEEDIMVPNSLVLSAVVMPLREPDSVDLRARLPADVKPSAVQTLLDREVTTPTRMEPRITLEEVDGDEVVVRIAATPADSADGSRLADEILEAVSTLSRA